MVQMEIDGIGENPGDSMRELLRLAEYSRQLQEEIDTYEGYLKDAKERKQHVDEHLLVVKMREMGIESVKLSDGTTVSLQKFYGGTFSADNPDVMQWLEQTGNLGIVKELVLVQLRAGEHDLAIEAAQMLQENGFNPNVTQSVHASTLKAFIKEMCESGRADDRFRELFKVYEGAIIKIK